MTRSSAPTGQLRSGVAIFDLDYDAILSAMYALSASVEGDCYRCVPPDPGIAASALGASESVLLGTALDEALHTFTQDSGASRCFFRDSTTLTPLPALVPVRLADPSEGPVVARSSTVLPCPAVPSGSLSGLHIPSFSTNLLSTAALEDAMVTTTTHRGSSLYTLATEPPHVAAYALVSASGQVAPPCSCRLLSHQTLLWHHRLGHPSLPRFRGMHSRLLVCGLPRSLPPLPPLHAPPCLPCAEGRQRAAPHSSSFPPTTAPMQTLHMDVWGPARVSEQGRERYFLLIRAVRLQLRERFRTDLPVLRLHSDRGGEFSSNLLRDFCRGEGVLQSFTLPASPQQNGVAEHRICLVMEGSRAFVRDSSADKLSARAIPCVFLGFVPNVPGWQFYHPTLRRVLPSHDVMFDQSVPFYRLFPNRSAPLPPPLLFLAPGRPTPGAVPGEVAVDLGVARGTASGGAEPGGAEPGGAEIGGAEPGGAATGGAEPSGAEPKGVEPGGAAPQGAASSGGFAGASPRMSSQQLRECLVRRARFRNGATGSRGAGVTTGAGVHGGARTRGAGAAGTSGVGGARDPTESGATGSGDSGANGAGAGGAGVGGAGAGGAGAGATGAGVGGADAGGSGAGGASAVGPGGALRPRAYFSQLPLLPASSLPAPSPYTEQPGSLTERREPASCPVLPVRTARRVPHSRPPPVRSKHAMALLPSSVPLRVPLPAPPESSLPEVPNPEFDRSLSIIPTVSRLLAAAVNDPFFESAAASALAAVNDPSFKSAAASALAAVNDPSSVAGSLGCQDGILEIHRHLPEKRNEPPPSKIEALDGSNYEEWSGRMRSAFKRYKLLKLAMGEEKMPEEGDARNRWIEKSAVLYDLILQSVNNDMFQHIKDLVELDDSGPKAWKLLRDVIQPNTLPMVIVLEKELAALSMRPGDDVKPVLDKIKDTYARMAAAGSKVSQMQQCTKIISVLDNSWDT
ncbi:unnamed protein product [Closterium sp. NIES-53]